MSYKKVNNVLGWFVFIIASAVYILTLEPTASFWDTGEFIAAAYKLQIVHQPGAPLFLMIEKLFSLLAGGDTSQLAYWMNVGSALASSATILFLFWTITALARKVVWPQGTELTNAKLYQIMGAGLVGSLAYTFSDSFWFSAVETEVYALSSLCTAVVFWAILKWEAHADEPKADRWLIFIAYVMGLSIGVHLLNLLTIPALALVYYFRRNERPTGKGTLLTLLVGIVILGVIQYGIIQYLVKFAAYFDLFFVNTLGLGFGTGVIFFAALLIGGLIFGIRYSIKRSKPVLNMALISTVFIIFGYSSFAMIIIRAKANPSLNNSAPDNAFAFLSYLNREQYGDRPLAYGQYFDSKPIDSKTGGKIYRKGDTKYEVAGERFERIYDRNTLMPRMYSNDGGHPGFYRDWMGLAEGQSPSFSDNLGFLFSYQVGHMYARYFAWNFVGRQNDVQGHGNYTDGNWISGVKPFDNWRLGGQDKLPPSITENKAYNRFYFLPFILGMIGAVWHFRRRQKDAGIVGLLFFFTGVAIVLYLNQTPLQPRERDYAFSGSFYAFAIWIGLGVIGIADFFAKKINQKTAAIAATALSLLAAPVLMASEGWDDHTRAEKYMTKDMAIDYLESCEPNAILFVYGDNDTYPLWYVQEVENVRPDIRIVNLSLLGTDWYIRQMKLPMNQSQPLPISMSNDKFVQGVRDVVYYQDYQFEGNLELKEVFNVMLSDNDEAKAQMPDGSKENILPTKNLKITINKDQFLASNKLDPMWANRVVPEMTWKYPNNYVFKTELAIFDILVHNNWKRPIYFAQTVPSDQFIGLSDYMFLEGLTYRLLPVAKPAVDSTNVDSQVGEYALTTPMYNNMMNKFKWGNMKKATYMDPESTRMIAILSNDFNILADNLLAEGKKEEARKALNKALEVIPGDIYSLGYTIRRYYLAENLYKVGENAKANQVIDQTADYIEKELNYLYAISQKKENLSGNEIQLGMSILNEMIRATNQYKQASLNAKLKAKFQSLESKFMTSMGGGR